MKTDLLVYIGMAMFFIFLLSFPIMGLHFERIENKVIEKNTQFCLDKNYNGYVNTGATFYCYKNNQEGFIIKSKERIWDEK